MAKFVPQAEMPLSDQVKVRRDKLEALRAEGLDPFQQTNFDVTSSARRSKSILMPWKGALSPWQAAS